MGWSVSITSHPIKAVVDLLAEERDWDPEPDDGDESVAGGWSNDLRGEQNGRGGKIEKTEKDGKDGKKRHRAVPIAAPEEDCVVSLLRVFCGPT